MRKNKKKVKNSIEELVYLTVIMGLLLILFIILFIRAYDSVCIRTNSSGQCVKYSSIF